MSYFETVETLDSNRFENKTPNYQMAMKKYIFNTFYHKDLAFSTQIFKICGDRLTFLWTIFLLYTNKIHIYEKGISTLLKYLKFYRIREYNSDSPLLVFNRQDRYFSNASGCHATSYHFSKSKPFRCKDLII